MIPSSFPLPLLRLSGSRLVPHNQSSLTLPTIPPRQHRFPPLHFRLDPSEALSFFFVEECCSWLDLVPRIFKRCFWGSPRSLALEGGFDLAGHGLAGNEHSDVKSLCFMKIAATHLRRSCFLHSFSVVFLYWFYVIS
jgi:hypothetical protein